MICLVIIYQFKLKKGYGNIRRQQMKIEILFPEICNLYGDRGNITYLKNVYLKQNLLKQN